MAKDEPESSEQPIRELVRISFRYQSEDKLKVMIVPESIHAYIVTGLHKKPDIVSNTIKVGRPFKVCVDQYHALISLRDIVMQFEAETEKVKKVFSQPQKSDPLHPETCQVITHLLSEVREQLWEMTYKVLAFQIGREGLETAILVPFPATKN